MTRPKDPIRGYVEDNMEEVFRKINGPEREEMKDMKKIGFPILKLDEDEKGYNSSLWLMSEEPSYFDRFLKNDRIKLAEFERINDTRSV